MDPNDIQLANLSKSFEYQKLSNKIDDVECIETLRQIAKSYAKLYLKQQEVMSSI